MVDLILVHVNESQARQQEELLSRTIQELVTGNSKIYNLPDKLEPAIIIERFRTHVTEIPYRDDSRDIFIQFFDAKRRLIEDGVKYIAICGQSKDWCIPSVERLMKAELNFHPPSLEQLGWSDNLYQEVLNRKIPYVILTDLLM